MEATGIWGILVLMLIVLASLWLFFDVLGFQSAGQGAASPH